MRQHAQMRARLGGLAANVDAVDAGTAAVRCQHSVQHPQGGRFAGAVGAQQAGDFTVARHEGDVAGGVDGAESLAQILGFDHGAGPVMLTKNGAGLCRARQVASSVAGAAVSRNSAISLGTQAVATWPCPSPLKIRWRWCARPRAARSALSGGVTGSASPDNNSVGISLCKGLCRSASTGPGGHSLQISAKASIWSTPW